MDDRAIGAQVTTILPGGERRFDYQFNDRGRGPKLATRVVIGAGRVPSLIENSGHDYLKGRVRERFDLTNGIAAWNNHGGEHGTRALQHPAFYISMTSVPEETALLARALLAAKDNRLPLLPEGEASLRRVGALKVRARTVVQYAIRGLDFAPTHVWLDEDDEFFAIHDGWLSVIHESSATALPALVAAQQEATAAHWERLARDLARRPARTLAFTGATLFDSESATTRPNTTVVVSGNRITAVGADGRTTIPAGAEVIDARGKMLVPGLWDMHAHLNDTDGPLSLAAGVTTVRDLGNVAEKLRRIREGFDSGRTAGPRVIAAGLIDGPGPYAGPAKVFVETEAEARATVDRHAGLGYEQIKIYSSVKPELVPAIIDQARKHGLRVGGHVPAFMSTERAVELGFDEVQHSNFIFLNFLAEPNADTRQAMRFTAMAEHAAEVGPDSPRVRRFIELLKERNVVVDPTLGIFESMFTDRAGRVSKAFEALGNRLPPQVRRGVLVGGLPVPHGMDHRYHASFASMQRMVRALYDAGVTIVAGTDSVGGFPLHRELELYAQAGIPAAQVLRLATLGAARVMKHDDELGSIAPGKLADFILVDGNPAERIGDIRKVETVVKDGAVYRSAELYRAMGFTPR